MTDRKYEELVAALTSTAARGANLALTTSDDPAEWLAWALERAAAEAGLAPEGTDWLAVARERLARLG